MLVVNALMIGDKVTVRDSKVLSKTGNESLVNRTGIVTKLVRVSGKLIGAYVDIKIMRRTKNYYIPISSIEGVDTINKARTLSILKSTIL